MRVYVTVCPFDTLSVTFAEKPLATDAAEGAVSPSKGISGYGDVVNFGANNME